MAQNPANQTPSPSEQIAPQPTAYELARDLKVILEANYSASAAAFKQIPGVNSLPNGLTPDEVKFSPEYRKALKACDRASDALRDFNGWFFRNFEAEARADREAKRTTRLAEVAS